jgi:hypothetical protein
VRRAITDDADLRPVDVFRAFVSSNEYLYY